MNEGLPAANGHHTALTGLLGEPLAVGLLLHYLNSSAREFHQQQRRPARCLTTKVTTGRLKGPRLDAWIDSGAGTLYQTEIKMWASNAFNGLRLSPDANADTLRSAGEKQWRHLWDEQQQTFLSPVVGKVLLPMRLPAGHEQAHVEPLACFWWMVQPPGGSPPWFTLKAAPSPHFPAANVFEEMHIFSLTAYLLSLPDDELILDLPLLAQRLDLIDQIVKR